MIYPTAKQRVQVLFVLPTNAARCWELENVWLAMAQLSSLDFKTNRHWSSSREALPWVLPRAKVKLPKAAKTKEKVPRLLAKALVSARKPQLSLSLNFDLCRSSESWHQKNRLEIEALEVMRSHEKSWEFALFDSHVMLCLPLPGCPKAKVARPGSEGSFKTAEHHKRSSNSQAPYHSTGRSSIERLRLDF